MKMKINMLEAFKCNILLWVSDNKNTTAYKIPETFIS